MKASSLKMFRPAAAQTEAEHADDEQDDDGVERQHEVGERQQHRRAAGGDGEGDGAEGADRGQRHDDVDELVQRVGRDRQPAFDQGRGGSRDSRRMACPEDQRDDQHLQELAAGEGADEVIGEDVEDEVRRAGQSASRCPWRPSRPRRAASAAPRPTPSTCPAMRPKPSATVDTSSKYTSATRPSLPTRRKSPADTIPSRHAEEHQGRDGGADQPQEDVAQDLAGDRERWSEQPKSDTQNHREKDLRA